MPTAEASECSALRLSAVGAHPSTRNDPESSMRSLHSTEMSDESEPMDMSLLQVDDEIVAREEKVRVVDHCQSEVP